MPVVVFPHIPTIPRYAEIFLKSGQRERAYTLPYQYWICAILLNIIVVRGITDTTFCVRPCVRVSRASAHCRGLFFLFGFLRKGGFGGDIHPKIADDSPTGLTGW